MNAKVAVHFKRQSYAVPSIKVVVSYFGGLQGTHPSGTWSENRKLVTKYYQTPSHKTPAAYSVRAIHENV